MTSPEPGERATSMLAVAPFLEGGIGQLMLRAAESYVEDYVFDDGESFADYVPTERERMLMTDMVNGLFAEQSFWGPVAALLAHLSRQEEEIKGLKRRATPVGGTDKGERRAAAKKLLCDVCACAAETEPSSLDLPHVVEGCLEPLETLIAERDACLYLSQQAHKYAGRDGRDIFDAIAEKAAADARAQAAESALSSLKGAVGKACDDLDALDSETKDRTAGAFAIKIGRALSSALSELESQCSAVAESKRREDAPSATAGSDGGER